MSAVIRPLERRLQLLTGKGGTGKTTLAAALALAHASRARRPLVVELGHRASLVRVLGVDAIGPEPREVAPGVHATNLDVHHATAALVGRTLPSGITTRALRAGPVRTFLDAAPGVGEIATLDRIAHFVAQTDFDPILVDGDATGHTRMLFSIHGVLGSLGVRGPVAALLDRVEGIFANEELAAVHVASLPTALAIEETLELWDELRASGRVAIGHVLLDRVEGETARDADPEALRTLEARLAGPAPGLASALALLRADHERLERTLALVARLAARGIGVLPVPDLEDRTLDHATLRALGRGLLDAEARA